ncbi:MAG: hypothetical protein IJS19_03005, partial [Muribaculaceae bacterium]|nr:hypothetical protein [Muribaculaceae bacterium]
CALCIELSIVHYELCINAIGSSADGFATAGCLSGNTRFGISPSHFVGSSFLIVHYEIWRKKPLKSKIITIFLESNPQIS